MTDIMTVQEALAQAIASVPLDDVRYMTAERLAAAYLAEAVTHIHKHAATAERKRLAALILPGTHAPSGAPICTCPGRTSWNASRHHGLHLGERCWHCQVRAALLTDPEATT